MFKKSGIALALVALAANGFAAELASDKDTKFEVNVDVGAYLFAQVFPDARVAQCWAGHAAVCYQTLWPGFCAQDLLLLPPVRLQPTRCPMIPRKR